MEEKCAEITKVFEQRRMSNEAELILSDADSQPCHEYHGVAHEGENSMLVTFRVLGQ